MSNGTSGLAAGIVIAVIAFVASRVAFGEGVPSDSPAATVKENLETLASDPSVGPSGGDLGIPTVEAAKEMSAERQARLEETAEAEDITVLEAAKMEAEAAQDSTQLANVTDEAEVIDASPDVSGISVDIGSPGGFISGGGLGGIDP